MAITGREAKGALKTVLFATDFSPAAERAGRFLTRIAKHSSSRVLILHALPPPALLHLADSGMGAEVARRDAEERLSKAASQLRAENIAAETILSEGLEPTRVILEFAAEKAANLIVIGSKGLSVAGRLALGSVAHQLIHQAEMPVFTAGPDAKVLQSQHNFQRIVCATDFSEAATAAVNFTLSFTQSHGAHMFLCHVLPKPDRKHPIDAQRLNERFKAELQRLIPDTAREWCDPECVVDHGYAVDGILLLANRVNADLIVLGAHRLSHWFEGIKTGIVFEVIRKARSPVLTVRSRTAGQA
jgi:nucleotide-binding universal stress UspA family protein